MQGSSAIQTVAALHPRVAHMTNYVRGQTWISIPFSGEIVSNLLGRTISPDATVEQRERHRLAQPTCTKELTRSSLV